MTDKQFDDAFTAAGGWFILTQYETIAGWTGSQKELADYIFSLGFDLKRTGSNTRVASTLRIIREHRTRDALVKIRDSKIINRQHPEASAMATKLLNQLNL